LVHEGLYEEARIVIAQTNSDGNVSDPVAVTIFKEIVDTLEWEKKEGQTMSFMEIVKTPVSRKRLLIGMSAGPFSCVVGNIIASYYLSAELDTAGITDPNDQLKAASHNLPHSYPLYALLTLTSECRPQRMVPCLLPRRHSIGRFMGSQTNSPHLPGSSGYFPVHYRWPVQTLC
jgi:hypothetical protein